MATTTDNKNRIAMVSVNSSSIDAVGWKDGTLKVRFLTGATYTHMGVPRAVYSRLLDADSTGSFYVSEIKFVYPHEKQS